MKEALMAKLRIDNVTKIFADRPEEVLEYLDEGRTKEEILSQTGKTVGVRKASFEVQAGETFVIMGLSGSGKSTLIRMLNRLIDPTAGEIQIDGIDITGMGKKQLREVRRKKIGMVFQNFALLPHKNVLENVEYGLKIQGCPSTSRKERALEALELVGLTAYETSMPHQLSGGMKQRVGLARALANDPDILLMDEAFSALDPLIRKNMQDELLQIQKSMQKTIVFITHDFDEALRIGGRIAVMKDGSIVQIGTPAEVVLKPADDYVSQFVEDVDLSHILRASDVQEYSGVISEERGLRGALQQMKVERMQSIYITNSNNKLLGRLSYQDAHSAIKSETNIDDILKHDTVCVRAEDHIIDFAKQVAASENPLAVLNQNNEFTGVITKDKLLTVISKSKTKSDHGERMDEAQVVSGVA